MADENRWTVDVRRRSFAEQDRVAGHSRSRRRRTIEADDRHVGSVDLRGARFMRRNDGARLGQLDRATGLALQLRPRMIVRVSTDVAVVRVRGLGFAPAIAARDPTHRLTDVERDPRRPRRDEGNRKEQCEEPTWHHYHNDTTIGPYGHMADWATTNRLALR